MRFHCVRYGFFFSKTFQNKLEMFDSNGNGAISPTAFWHEWKNGIESATKYLNVYFYLCSIWHSVVRRIFPRHHLYVHQFQSLCCCKNIEIQGLMEMKTEWFFFIVVIVVSTEMHFLIWCTILKKTRDLKKKHFDCPFTIDSDVLFTKTIHCTE